LYKIKPWLAGRANASDDDDDDEPVYTPLVAPDISDVIFETKLKVRAVSRSISPRWRSIRFRLALRTYAPWACIVRVVSLAKSRNINTHPEKYYRSFP